MLTTEKQHWLTVFIKTGWCISEKNQHVEERVLDSNDLEREKRNYDSF